MTCLDPPTRTGRIGMLPWAGPPRGGVARRGGLRARCDRKPNALLTRQVFFADASDSDASATCQERVGTGHASATRQGRVRNVLGCPRNIAGIIFYVAGMLSYVTGITYYVAGIISYAAGIVFYAVA